MPAGTDGWHLDRANIPAKERISLEVTDTGTGKSWTESDDGCGPSKNGVAAKNQRLQRGIYLDPALAPYGTVDGALSLGVPLTASEPASKEVPGTLPECKRNF